MPEPTFLLMTVSVVKPEQVWKAVQILNEQARQAKFSSPQGLRQSLLIESEEAPGRLTWVSTWDTKADSQVFLGSDGYTNLVSEMKPYLLREPEWHWYSVLQDWSKHQEQAD